MITYARILDNQWYFRLFGKLKGCGNVLVSPHIDLQEGNECSTSVSTCAEEGWRT